MKVLVVGLGSIGWRHAANLKAIDPSLRVVALRRRPSSQAQNSQSVVDKEVYSLKEALSERPQAAIIANPAPFHIETALALAKNRIHLFIEKPISDSLERVGKLLGICERNRLVLMVGYNLRFHEPLQIMRRAMEEGRIGRLLGLRAEAGQYLADWRPGRDYRDSVTAQRSLGGGVLFELSHEIDYARWLAGEVESVAAVAAKVSDLDIDVEDTAEISLRFKNGALGQIHLDMVARPKTRTCRLIGSEGTFLWDGLANSVKLYEKSSGRWNDLFGRRIDANETYLAELRNFFECVREGRSPLVSGQDGKKVLEIILAAKKSSQTGRAVNLLSQTKNAPRELPNSPLTSKMCECDYC